MATAFDEAWERVYGGKAAGGGAMERTIREIGMKMWNAAILEAIRNSPGAIALADTTNVRSLASYFAESSERIRNLFLEVPQ